MSSSFFRLGTFVLICLAAVLAVREANGLTLRSQSKAGTLFKGLIGDARIEMDLKREGESLSGSYFYLKSGSSRRLRLKGMISADGTFTILESDAAGKQTGQFQGKWKEDPNDPGAWLDGQWLKPGQTDGGLGFDAWEQMVYFAKTEVTTRVMRESIKLKKAELTAEYPELSGGTNAAAFNALAQARVTRSLAAFKKELGVLTARDIRESNEGNYIDVGYNIEFADDDLISVNFSEDAYEGGAHPNHNTFTLTYDLKRGREVTLSELFKPGSKYLTVIADYAMRDLKERKDPDTGENMGLAQDVFEDGAKPTVDNYRNWNITKKGLLITFPPYQVAAYAYGAQTVMIPLSQLKGIGAPGGALSKAGL